MFFACNDCFENANHYVKSFSKTILKLPWEPYQFCEQLFKTNPIQQKRHKKLNNDFLAESKYLVLLHT